MVKRRKQRIIALQNENGSWINDEEDLKGMASKYYQELYSKDGNIVQHEEELSAFPTLRDDQLLLLNKEVDNIEIKNAIFSMGAFKAPGPDGIQTYFFQTQWAIIREKICDLVRRIFQNPSLIKEVNHTNMVLIPKVESPVSLKDFRPISLCNVSFKIITKIIANRLKGVMNDLIGPEQCSFIASRSSCDNIIIAQEAINLMRTKPGRKGYVAVKVDMEKAFDRLDWDFLEGTLKCIGLNQHLIDLIMASVKLVSMKILWNGSEGEVFHSARGVR